MISDIYDLKIYLKALADGTMLTPEMQKERLKWALDKDEPVSYTHLTLPTSDLV